MNTVTHAPTIPQLITATKEMERLIATWRTSDTGRKWPASELPLKLFPTTRPTCGKNSVYFLFLNGELRYIGRSGNFVHRMAKHRLRGNPHDVVFYQESDSCKNWNLYEVALIKFFQPPKNENHTRRNRRLRGDAWCEAFASNYDSTHATLRYDAPTNPVTGGQNWPSNLNSNSTH